MDLEYNNRCIGFGVQEADEWMSGGLDVRDEGPEFVYLTKSRSDCPDHLNNLAGFLQKCLVQMEREQI
jgi:hypothetical protein